MEHRCAAHVFFISAFTEQLKEGGVHCPPLSLQLLVSPHLCTHNVTEELLQMDNPSL